MRGLLRPKQKVFIRGEKVISAHSRYGRLLVGKPRYLDSSSKYTLKEKSLLRSNVTRNLRLFLTRPLPRPSGGARKGLLEVYAWGEGASGQLGIGGLRSKHTPQRVKGLSARGILHTKGVTPVSCGLLHAGVVNSFGQAFTWGSNFFFQVGHDHSAGGLVMALEDTEPWPGSLRSHLPKNFECKAIACGGWHTVLLGELTTKQGRKRMVYAWGNGGQGQLGLLEKERYHVSTKSISDETVARQPWPYSRFPEVLPQLTKDNKDPERIVMIAAGAVHSVALSEQGEVYWWGENRYVTTPEKLDLLATEPLRFKFVACGAFHTLGVTTDGRVYSWGAGRVNPEASLHAQLDPHMIVPVDSVAPPPRYKFTLIEISNVVSVAAADDASLALTDKGALYFWRGTLNKPKQILQGVKIVDYSISWTHIAAVTDKGELYMWRMEENKVTAESNKAYQAQWEDPATRDVNYVGTVPLPPFRGGRKGHVPHVGSLSTPLHLTHDPSAPTAPTRILGPLAQKSVVGVRLGWNFALATAVQQHVGPKRSRQSALLRALNGAEAALRLIDVSLKGKREVVGDKQSSDVAEEKQKSMDEKQEPVNEEKQEPVNEEKQELVDEEIHKPEEKQKSVDEKQNSVEEGKLEVAESKSVVEGKPLKKSITRKKKHTNQADTQEPKPPE